MVELVIVRFTPAFDTSLSGFLFALDLDLSPVIAILFPPIVVVNGNLGTMMSFKCLRLGA